MEPLWPISRLTGQLYDDDWLREGTGPLNPEQIQRAHRAALAWGSDAEPASKAEIAEYWRFKSRLIGDPARVLRGFDLDGWQDHVAHMKRTNNLGDALTLSYECMDKARASHGGPIDSWFRWTRECAVILRKLKDYDAEVRLLEEFLAERPNMASSIGDRLIKARSLSQKNMGA